MYAAVRDAAEALLMENLSVEQLSGMMSCVLPTRSHVN